MKTIEKTKTLLTVKTDKNLKKAAQETAFELGLPLGTLVNAMLKQLVRTKEISFNTAYQPSAYLIKIMRQAEKDLASDKVARADNIDELVKQLAR